MKRHFFCRREAGAGGDDQARSYLHSGISRPKQKRSSPRFSRTIYQDRLQTTLGMTPKGTLLRSGVHRDGEAKRLRWLFNRPRAPLQRRRRCDRCVLLTTLNHNVITETVHLISQLPAAAAGLNPGMRSLVIYSLGVLLLSVCRLILTHVVLYVLCYAMLHLMLPCVILYHYIITLYMYIIMYVMSHYDAKCIDCYKAAGRRWTRSQSRGLIF